MIYQDGAFYMAHDHKLKVAELDPGLTPYAAASRAADILYASDAVDICRRLSYTNDLDVIRSLIKEATALRAAHDSARVSIADGGIPICGP